MRKFLIGAAVIALAASGAIAEPGGKGGGGGKGNDKGHAAQSHGKHGGGDGGKEARQQRGPSRREAKAVKAERGKGHPEVRVERQAAKGNGAKAEKRNDRAGESRIERGNQRHAERVKEKRAVRDIRHDLGDDDGVRVIRAAAFGRDRSGIIEGCPPGLAKKNNGCMPPGLAKQRDTAFRRASHEPSWWGYDRLGDGRYFYDEGYLFRLGNDNSVLGYVPLLGGALSIGNRWPSYYEPYPVPRYYQDYYNLGPADSYRYADDVLYRVDPQTGVIDSIAALLTGDTFAVGQPLPEGYDVYNVPYGYQDQYYDTDDAYYRYADGYVYEADPTTQLVQAVIELLV